MTSASPGIIFTFAKDSLLWIPVTSLWGQKEEKKKKNINHQRSHREVWLQCFSEGIFNDTEYVTSSCVLYMYIYTVHPMNDDWIKHLRGAVAESSHCLQACSRLQRLKWSCSSDWFLRYWLRKLPEFTLSIKGPVVFWEAPVYLAGHTKRFKSITRKVKGRRSLWEAVTNSLWNMTLNSLSDAEAAAKPTDKKYSQQKLKKLFCVSAAK